MQNRTFGPCLAAVHRICGPTGDLKPGRQAEDMDKLRDGQADGVRLPLCVSCDGRGMALKQNAVPLNRVLFAVRQLFVFAARWPL
jgi:hypothetical protein